MYDYPAHFVSAPTCEVHIPLVQADLHITNRVCQVPTNQATVLLRMRSDCLHIKLLTRVVVYTTQANHGYGFTLFI